MPANVETLFYVSNDENQRFVPWHGLGTPVEQAPTSSDAIKLAGLDWKVESKPIYAEGDIEIPGYRANTRDKDNKVLGVVSDRYQIVQNDEAFAFTDALLGAGVKYESAGSLRDGKTVYLLAKMPQTLILGEEFDPFLCFTNNHEGTGAVRVCMTPVRVVCQNTLNLALSTAKRTWSTKHMGDMASKVREAEETLGLATDYMKLLGEQADQLAHKKVTDDQVKEIIEDLFPINDDDSDRAKRNMQELRDGFYVCYMAPDIQKYLGTAYGVVNAASDFATHKEPKRMTSTFKENNFARILNGNAIIDKVFEKVSAF